MSDIPNTVPHRLRFPTLRVKAKSLAAEARIIKHEEGRAMRIKDTETLKFLRLHRIHVVRREARLTNLALAYLRGRTYASVEGNCRRFLILSDIKSIIAMIMRHSPDNTPSIKVIENWIDCVIPMGHAA